MGHHERIKKIVASSFSKYTLGTYSPEKMATPLYEYKVFMIHLNFFNTMYPKLGHQVERAFKAFWSDKNLSLERFITILGSDMWLWVFLILICRATSK